MQINNQNNKINNMAQLNMEYILYNQFSGKFLFINFNQAVLMEVP